MPENAMKVRIGLGAGLASGVTDRSDASFAALVDGLEGHGFDSLWVSERATGPLLDPVTALAFAAGRTSKLKLGTSVQVLPGRNPVLLAKAWASLDRLSDGRALPAFGLGVVDEAEQQAFGIERAERAARFDESLEVLRLLWHGSPVDFHGAFHHYHGVGIGVRPVQETLDVWLGGRSPGELRRVGRVADGWLPSFCTPDQVAAGRVTVDGAAEVAGRNIDPEHFGAVVAYARHAVPVAYAAERARRLGVDAAEVVPVGLDALRARLEEFVAVGFSKFVVVPAEPVASWDDELGDLADTLLPLQTRS
jgi:probable F420-dependent oxidoreductase